MNEPTPLQLFFFKLSLYARLGWGLIIIFCLVGMMSGGDHATMATTILVLTVIARGALQIMDDFKETLSVIRELNRSKDDQGPTDDQDH